MAPPAGRVRDVSTPAGRLIEATIDVAALVASILAEGRDGATSGKARGAGASLARRCVEKTPALGHWKDLLERCRSVVEGGWREAPPRRRPDVLEMTCRVLANPARLETLHVVRFCVVLALRALYRVRHDKDGIEALRDAHRRMRSRFEHQQSLRETVVRPGPAPNTDQLIIDTLCLHGYVRRSMSDADFGAYCRAFAKAPLGIDPARAERRFAGEQPQLKGDPPDFPTLVNLLFAQPTGILGVDDVLGGMLPMLNGGGQVTVLAGPAGSGKTTFCLAVAARALELGADVRYLSTEENKESLRAKLLSTGGGSYLSEALWAVSDPDAPELPIVDARPLDSVEMLEEILREELQPKQRAAQGKIDVVAFLPFPRLVVVDSISALIAHDGPDAAERRRSLAAALASLRELGVSVWLVGGAEDAKDASLEYLVDNVLLLDTDPSRSDRHPLRTCVVEKTRLQTSHRGRHVLHLSRTEGCIVSPSLHAVIRDLHEHDSSAPSDTEHAVVHTEKEGRTTRALTLRARSQVLVHGRGSAGKAKFALRLALEPAVPTANRSTKSRRAKGRSRACPRVLVVSFLYPESYYLEAARDTAGARFGEGVDVADRLSVIEFYPGFIDPETVVAKISRELEGARIAGTPYSALVVDGVHNVLLQYPLLEGERLLWPAVSRLARAYQVTAITTFTFFEMPGSDEREPAGLVDVSSKIFFHLLVSSADYSFIVEREERPDGRGGHDQVRVRLASSIDGFDGVPAEFVWDPRGAGAARP